MKRALELVETIYETEPVGGPLHVVIDDWNIDGTITVDTYDIGEDIDQCSPEADMAIRELVPLLNRMTVAERASALARNDGYLPREPSL
ncbi:hypothetical protein [Streptomyces sp. NPDC090022]|uniref:hypothetical protein n=1 Tax=Streptomyces sp. NPDC090022 TaxID=3365920 RepID=UPI003804CD7A